MAFSLIDDPWIPLHTPQGYALATPLEALTRSEAQLAADPYEELPVLRWLLFLLGWTFQGKDSEDVAALEPEAWAQEAHKRLQPYRARFTLGRDFYLWRDYDGPVETPTALRPDWPSGGMADLAQPRWAGSGSLDWPGAVRAMLAGMSYTPGGLYNRYGRTRLEAGPLAEGLACYAQGRTLGDTLRLNLLVPERLTAPWETPFRTPEHPLELYVAPTRGFCFDPSAPRLSEVIVGYGADTPRGLPDPMKAYPKDPSKTRPLTPMPGQALFEAVFPRLREYRFAQVVEVAAAQEFTLGIPFALRMLAQIRDQATTPALLLGVAPRLDQPGQAFRLRLSEEAYELALRLHRTAGELGLVKRGTWMGQVFGPGNAFLAEASEVVLTAPNEEEGIRALYRVYRSRLEETLSPALRRAPQNVARLMKKGTPWNKKASNKPPTA